MGEKSKYLAKNTIIFAISSFSTKFITFFLVPLYTSILTTSEYGVADLITTSGTLLISIFTLNISEAVLRYTMDKEVHEKNLVLEFGIKVILTGGLITLVLMLLIYKLNIINWRLNYYIFMYGYFLIVAFYQLLSNYARAIDEVKAVAIAGIVSSVVTIISNIFLLLIFKFGINGYIVSIIIGPFIANIYLIQKSNISIKYMLWKKATKTLGLEMIKYSFPLVFNSIALWINAYLDRYFITGICGVAQNGIYSVASKIPSILSMCYTVFAQAWTLSAVKEFDKNDEEGFFSKTYNIYNALMVLACTLIILFNIPLARILYNKDFFVAWKCSSILLISVLFNSLTAFQGSIFGAIKKTKIIAYTTIFSALINIILNIIFINKFGIVGAAIATVISYIVMWIIRFFVLKKYIKMKINVIRDLLVYLLIGIQVLCEHFNNHGYIVQVIIVIMVLWMYRATIKTIINNLFKVVKYRVKRDENNEKFS